MLDNLSKVRDGTVRYVVPFIQLIIVGVYSWPLMFKLPHTLYALYQAFRPGGAGISDKNFWAFGRVDAGFRPWYTKIAQDYLTQGRFGYVWDDGLGMPLGARIYNNFITYRLLFWLGTRRMMALGFVVMVLFSSLIVSYGFNPWVGVIVALLAVGSPLLVGSYTHLGKPEVFWWGIAIPAVFLMLSGNVFVAGLLWSVIAWANLSVSVMPMLLLGPALLFLLPFPGLLALALGALPGVIKHGMRGIYMWRSDFLANVIGEQSQLWKRPWYPTVTELLWWLPFAVSIMASAYALQQPLVGGMLLLVGVGLYWINFRFFYLNDVQGFHLAFWVIGLCYAATAQSLPALLAILAMTYVRPDYCGFPIAGDAPSQDVSLLQRRLRKIRVQMQSYPALMPTPLPQPPSLMTFFNRIPNGARILIESDGDPRTESKFQAFWQWTEEFLPRRQVDLANEIYTRLVEAELVDRYLNRFNAEKMSAQEMASLCRVLGVSYVVAHSRMTTESLESVGFVSIVQVDLAELNEFRAIVPTPPVILTLLRNLEEITVIDPAVAWQRSGNELAWDARAGQTYVVRYCYNAQFRAHQDGREVDIEPLKPIDNIHLQFMQVGAILDGRIVMKFHRRWI